MSEELSPKQIKEIFKRWLEIRLKWQGEKYEYFDTRLPFTAQLIADIDHSSLLQRLLEGKEPLPEPPPLKYSYPDYPNEEQK